MTTSKIIKLLFSAALYIFLFGALSQVQSEELKTVTLMITPHHQHCAEIKVAEVKETRKPQKEEKKEDEEDKEEEDEKDDGRRDDFDDPFAAFYMEMSGLHSFYECESEQAVCNDCVYQVIFYDNGVISFVPVPKELIPDTSMPEEDK